MTIGELLSALDGEDPDLEVYIVTEDNKMLEIKDTGIHEGKQVIYAGDES